MTNIIYIASPFGFSEAGRFFMYNEIIPLLENNSFEIIDPWKLTDQEKIDTVEALEGKEKRLAWEKLNYEIGENNKKGIEASNIILAILDGTDIDSGTASEIGFGVALGKKVVGYRSDFRLSGDNIGATVNLQVEYFIKSSGGKIVRSLNEVTPALNDLDS